MQGLCTRDHPGKLRADDGLRAERLTKCLALRDPFETFLGDHPLRASGCTNHHPTLVVEVAQDNEDPTTLGAERVLDRDADVIKGDEGRAGSRRVGRLDRRGGDTLLTGYENDCQTILSRVRVLCTLALLSVLKAHLGSTARCEADIGISVVSGVGRIPVLTNPQNWTTQV